MAELLHRIRAEIRARLEASRPAVDEYQMLEAALTAIDGVSGARRASTAEPSAPAPKRPVARRTSRPSAKRAPRGANRVAVLRILDERPGVGATERSVASGVSRPALYQLLAKLAEQGEVVKEKLPGGGTGYALRRGDADRGGTATPPSATVA